MDRGSATAAAERGPGRGARVRTRRATRGDWLCLPRDPARGRRPAGGPHRARCPRARRRRLDVRGIDGATRGPYRGLSGVDGQAEGRSRGRLMTRRSRSAHEKRLPPPPGPGWIILYVAGMATIVFVIGALLSGVAVRTVSYTEFKRTLRAGEISEAVVSQSRIRGTLKRTDERVSAVRVSDPNLLAELEQQGVKVTGESSGDGWSVLAWLLPMALIFYIWTRGMRGIGEGQGALSFGHSHAKVYAEDDVKVTFADVAGIDEATEELWEIVDFLQHPEKYTALGARIP